MYKRAATTLKMLLATAMGLSAMASQAGTITFDFNTRSSGNSLAKNATNAGIQTYMNNVLGSAGSVTVTGARADNNYNGDGHVVGPCSSYNQRGQCTAYSSQTLANGETLMGSATRDTFIINNSPSSDAINMAFNLANGNLIYSVSFDWEIFPDGTCPSLQNCGKNNQNLPDFKFLADGNLITTFYGSAPSTPGYTHSPNSGTGTELAPQALGHYTYTFSTGVSALTFQDWPATIGIDNLVITYDRSDRNPPPPVPEPATLTLVGAGALSALYKKLRKK